jgi:hypothetical protein
MISLPTDLLPFIFSFLSSKELCCLDSAILNHANRPVFLSALIQRFTKESLFNGEDNASFELVTRWYLCRRIPITDLTLDNVPYPKGLNFIYLKSILLYDINLHDEDLLVISQCSNLKKLDIYGCSFPPHFDISSLLEGLSSLEQLELDYVPFSTLTVEIICRHCQSLKSLELSSLDSVGDDELRLLLEGCPSLHSLRLLSLPISQESVIMLRNCQILSIGIRYCEGVSLESVLSLLKEVTIPTIFNSDATQELQISALGALHFSIPYTPQSEIPQISEFLTNESLLKRLVELLAHKNRFRNTLIDFLNHIARSGYHRLVVAAGVVPVLVRHFESFRENEEELRFAFLLLQLLSFKSIYQQHLLTSGVLSIFRLHRSQSVSQRSCDNHFKIRHSSCLRNLTEGKSYSPYLRSSLNRWFRSKIGSAQFRISFAGLPMTFKKPICI